MMPLVLACILWMAIGHAPDKTEPMKIIYVYDALCGWCYGFSPVMQQLYEEHNDDYAFEVIAGGMITGERIGPIGEVAPYIKEAYKEVEHRTGVKFGKAFLENVLEEGNTVFTSIPPSIALALFKRERPEEAVLFATRVQKAIYYEGMPPGDWSAYGPLVEEFGLDGAAFVASMQSEEGAVLAEADFQRAQAFGVSGFPTVIVQQGDEYFLIARGYTDFNILNTRLQSLIDH